MAPGRTSPTSSPSQIAQCHVPSAITNGPSVASNPLGLPHEQTDEEKQQSASKYYGYPALSEWMASSYDFFVLRRYSKESARCLLRLQNEIAKISKRLDDLDEFSRQQPRGLGGCGSFDNDSMKGRTELIVEMEHLLQRYCASNPVSPAEVMEWTLTADSKRADDLVNAFSQVRKNQTAREHHVRNLNNWFYNRPGAIDPQEQHFREKSKQGDLFPILLKERSPLRLFLGQSRCLRSIFTPRRTAGQIESTTTWYTSETGIDRFTNTVIVFFGLGLLFGPMWALHFVGNDRTRLAIITAFVFSFTILAFLAAGQRPFEILAATAAYTAVLMVYVQDSGE